MTTPLTAIPGLGRPARDALADAGYTHLEALHGVAWHDLLALHGVGARRLERLQAGLLEHGLSLADAPSPRTRR